MLSLAKLLADTAAPMSPCDILLDANVALHFRRFDQVDWCALTRCSDCTIVIAPMLLRELEQKKISAASSVLRDRAGAMIEYVVSKLALPDPIKIRSNVTLAFVEDEPSIDFASHRLVREVNDDHYIAAALERSAKFGRPTLIASNDGVLALKLRTRAVSILRLPDDLRLPAEPDPAQKKLGEIRSLIARLESSRPRLAVTFKNGELKMAGQTNRPPPLTPPSLEEVRAQHPFLKPNVGSVGGLHGRAVVERYNRSLEAYYSAHERYLEERELRLGRLRLATQVELELHNDGTATATDVDVAVQFPAGIAVLSIGDVPREPEQPVPPPKLGTMAAVLGPNVLGTAPSNPPPATEGDATPVHVFPDERKVRFSAKSIEQKTVLTTDKFWITHDPDQSEKVVEVGVDIRFHQGGPVSDKLEIAVGEEVEQAKSA